LRGRVRKGSPSGHFCPEKERSQNNTGYLEGRDADCSRLFLLQNTQAEEGNVRGGKLHYALGGRELAPHPQTANEGIGGPELIEKKKRIKGKKRVMSGVVQLGRGK